MSTSIDKIEYIELSLLFVISALPHQPKKLKEKKSDSLNILSN